MSKHEEDVEVVNEMENETEAEAAPETDAEIQAEAEAAADGDEDKPAAPFDENELLELAKNEGLVDLSAEEEETETQSDLDLSEEQQAELVASMETILFMSDKPVSLPKLRSTINPEVPLSAYRKLMARLREEFANDHRGVEIAEVSLGFQLRTKPHMSSVLRKMVKTQPLKLSGTTLEVLAIVAYKQPVTKDEVDRIRGVDSGYVLRNLMEKRLVRISGRSDLPGRPMLYSTSHEFLELFNLKDVKALPPLHEVEAMVAASEVGAEEKMNQALEEFGKMVETSDKILFDDSQLDEELEAIRAEIANVRTSTDFIDQQKTRERLENKIKQLAEQGMGLDLHGHEVPLDSPEVATIDQIMDAKFKPKQEEEAPAEVEASTVSTEVATETAAESEAQLQPSDEVVETLAEATVTETVVSDSEIIIQVSSEAVLEAAEEISTAEAPVTEMESETETVIQADHQPSNELEEAAQEAQWERHAEMIQQAVEETEVALVNAEALADAVSEAKAEQELDAAEQKQKENLDL